MKTLLSYLLVLGLVAATAHAQTPTATDAAPRHHGTPSSLVHVTGAVKATRDFDLAAIKALAGRDTGPVDVICASGATVAKVNNFRGVRLTDLINHAGIDEQGHKDTRRMVIIARATDGYVVTFSWNELFNTAIGKDVLVAYEKDGKPLDAGEGQFLLVSGQDIKTGPRHVRWLNEIEIKREQ
ncbi:hypothetical protein RHOFW510R12_00155 [Rhodanobacter sp. FW510-R12]|uniref:molybdopterin-dependent oxidoreductase n=1 Tax=unclassified Rhodanobacter TaxID=2621553 RepID=UPI0007A999BB|nr:MULTISPECIES: molybdopterin-dependent oxidoreductase [unclassified Rhodanobacter]KZC15595.1 hypothetical protein RHOFW104R8_04090 [Rhodanobacter sp. FW104-R8]KZC28318.1 hypothetical protein RhoFW510T8_11710 [Rhodanobacter sp. FW510-T8]KZC32693.1 hypothetical protein RhoFW510R10_11230 [Rhodanobacter sp. FW510-R10]